MRKYLIAAGVALLCLLLVVCTGVFSPDGRTQAETNVLAQYGPIVKEKDAQGVETAVRLAQGNPVKAVAKQNSKLGKAVKKEGKKTKSATIVELETAGHLAAVPPDPAADSSVLAFNDEWIQAKVNLRSENPTLDYRVRNELEIFQVSKSNGVFKPNSLEVKVRNLNPHSTVTDLQSFAVQLPKKRTGLWLSLGFAAGATTAFYLLN